MVRGGLGGIMKQAQQMQRRMAQVQEELEKKQIEASSGGGMVTAVVNGKQQRRWGPQLLDEAIQSELQAAGASK